MNIRNPIQSSLALAFLLSILNSMPRRNAVKAGQLAATWLLALLLLAAINASLSTCFAQGSLTPPGAPVPSMKSLAQIEPRTPINTLSGDSQDLYVISQPGSYYLTTNITATGSINAISINTNGVSLDLSGFTISSTGANGTAILLAGNQVTGIGNADITISNGHITGSVTNNAGTYSGPGFYNGISYNIPGGTPYNVRVSGVSVSGCQYFGILLGTGNSTVAESCTVNTVGSYGIQASGVFHSTAVQCGAAAINADNATDCYGNCTGYSYGMIVSYAADNCFATSLSGAGLLVASAHNCMAMGSGTGDGLDAVTASDCYGYCSGTGTGLHTPYAANNCIGYSGGSGFGLSASVANNCIGDSVSGTGLSAGTANNCNGQCVGTGTGLSAASANNCIGGTGGGGTGLSVTGVAIGCYCFSSSGVAITAHIANSCTVSSGTTNITYKYNMP
jgi:hypothetical protein